MKKYLFQISLFILPILSFAFLPCLIFFMAKENLTNLDKVIKDDHKYLIGIAYSEVNKHIKWKHLQTHNNYEVVAMGSSRALPFRDIMFTKSFYNAGQTVTSMGGFLPFLKSLPEEKLPKYLLINIDQWWFNDLWIQKQPKYVPEAWTHLGARSPDFNIQVKIWNDFLEHKISLPFPRVKDKNFIGLNAIFNQTGVRNDGSYFYGGQIDKLEKQDASANDFNFMLTFDKMKKGTLGGGFEYGDQISKICLDDMDSFLKFCKEKQVFVIGFLPPYAEIVYNKMIEMGKYKYLQLAFQPSFKIFVKYGFELYDYSRLFTLSANDTEMLDGVHAGELTYVRILMRMLEAGSRLKEVCDFNQLEGDLKKVSTTFSVYEE